MFETFRRLEDPAPVAGGTWLDLVIVPARAEAMNMTVANRNRSGGKGAEFTVVFPPALIVRDTARESVT